MTVRQVYYQLVARQIIDNDHGRYSAVSKVRSQRGKRESSRGSGLRIACAGRVELPCGPIFNRSLTWPTSTGRTYGNISRAASRFGWRRICAERDL